jgi:thiamine kinase-like enzyme
MENAMIPQEKHAAVSRAFREAFGVTEFDDIRMMMKGQTSSLVFRVVVRGSPYLLKIIMRKDMLGPARNFACMKATADAGLSPRVWYTNVEDQISITDFVETVRFPAGDALTRIPAVLRTLHSLPPFPGVENQFNTTCMFLMNEGPPVDGFKAAFKAANALTQRDTEDLFALCEQLAAVYPRHDRDMVSSHNDLFKPDNILFDGRTMWLVDWEAAFLNDRYADLAVAANHVVTSDVEEATYLREYFGQPPDPYQRARFFLMQQIAHIFYAVVFLLQGSSGQPVNQSEAPEFHTFHRRMWEGDVNLADKDAKLAYGRAHWGQLIQNTQHRRFDEALRTVAERHPLP